MTEEGRRISEKEIRENTRRKVRDNTTWLQTANFFSMQFLCSLITRSSVLLYKIIILMHRSVSGF